MNKEIEIGLRVQAQLDEARTRVQALKGDVTDLGKAGKQASADVSTIPTPGASTGPSSGAKTVDKAATETAAATKQATEAINEQTGATKAQAAAQDQQAEAATRAASAEERRQAALAKTAATSEQEAKLEAFKKRQAQASEEAATATEKEKQAVDRLMASLAPAESNTQRMAAAQTELNTALSKGLITQEQHTRLLALAQQRYSGLGVSAGQTAAAMRMLPAQFTDVATSIASGMPIWLVAIQQGGQIKDSFGGIGPAARAMTSLITPASAAMTGLAVAVGGALAIMRNAEKESMAFGVAIQTTGNAAGATASRIEELAERARDISGISEGAARDAAVAMVQSGRLGIQVIDNLTQGIRGYAQATNSSTEGAAASLSKMFANPAQAAKQLDDQFHLLEPSQRSYIARLVEQGRTEEAQLLLSQRVAEHFGKVVPANLGYLQKAWDVVASSAQGAWNWMLDWGRQESLKKQLEEATAAVDTWGRRAAMARRLGGSLSAGDQAAMDTAQKHLADVREKYAADEKKADEAAAKGRKDARLKQLKDQFDAEGKQYETGADMLKRKKEELDELLKAGPLSGGISQKEYDDRLAALNKKANSGTPKGDSAAQIAIEQIKSDLKLLQATVKSSDALVVKALEDGRTTLAEAYAKRMEGLEQDFAAQREALQKEMAASGTTKSRKVEIAAELKLLEQSKRDASRDTEAWRKAEELKLANLTVRLRVDTSALTGQFDREAIAAQLRQQYAVDLQATGRISDPKEANAAKERIELLIQAGAAQAEFNNKLAEAQRLQGQLGVIEQAIQNQVSSGQISQIEGEARIRQARAAQVPMLQQIMVELERIRDALPPDAAVAIDSMNTSIGQLRNTAAAATPVIVDLGTRLTNTMVDGVADAAATAVSNFSNLRDAAATTLKQIAADIVRSDIKRLLTNLFTVNAGGSGTGGTVIGSLVSGVKSVFGYAEGGSPSTGGGRIIGPGTGTSDSIAAVVDGVRPIRVSNNEFIHPERAVQHYGLPFMEAVRTLRLPKPQFAFGGLIAASQRVRFATGGTVSNGGVQSAGAAGPAQVRVELITKGTPQRVQSQQSSFDGKETVVKMILSDFETGGPISRGVGRVVRRDGG